MKMFSKVSVIILFCGMLVELLTDQERYFNFQAPFSTRVFALVCQGSMFLLYPVLGHLADVCLNRYRTIRWSFLPMLCGNMIILFGELAGLVLLRIIGSKITHHPYSYLTIFLVIGFFINVIGAGLYEANIIQFGLDQLLEAPTTKSVTFIHWYYWAENVGRLVSYYIIIASAISIDEIITIYTKDFLTISLEAILPAITIIKDGAVLTLFLMNKKDFYIQKAGLNPFKNIYKVLKYSWKHKVPEHRSAFTYWEEDIPRRIDLGKTKYGGPFTNEEVEDTKTFLRILSLLLCLFGYHLAGDGYSAPDQLLRTSCPSLPVLLLITINPLHISTLVVVVAIPLYRLIIKKLFPHFRGILILTRIWIGLFLCLVQTVIHINVVLNHDTKYWQNHSLPRYKPNIDSSKKFCLHNSMNGTREILSQPVDNTYLWFIIPQLLNGLSSLFVSMTVFEFICAQAPRTTQGLLIGLWYATFSIRYLVVGILDNVITEKRSWLICEGVKGFLILVSLVLFSFVTRRYRYRQRDEIVNVQGMIEDTHERWLDQEEEYMQECRAILAQDHLKTINYNY